MGNYKIIKRASYTAQHERRNFCLRILQHLGKFYDSHQKR